jgi:dTDP-4-amino-4,6-dideoxygalactose transaminase
MISTSNKKFYDRLKLLRQHAMSVNDRVRHESHKIIFEDHIEIGYNYRMTDIQASVGIEQLNKLDLIINKRRKIAKSYINALKKIKYLKLPEEKDGYVSNYQSFSIYLNEETPIHRNELMQYLLDNGISSRRGIMTCHQESAYIDRKDKLPISENLRDNSIIIPLYYQMKEKEIKHIIGTILKILS